MWSHRSRSVTNENTNKEWAGKREWILLKGSRITSWTHSDFYAESAFRGDWVESIYNFASLREDATLESPAVLPTGGTGVREEFPQHLMWYSRWHRGSSLKDWLRVIKNERCGGLKNTGSQKHSLHFVILLLLLYPTQCLPVTLHPAPTKSQQGLQAQEHGSQTSPRCQLGRAQGRNFISLAMITSKFKCLENIPVYMTSAVLGK